MSDVKVRVPRETHRVAQVTALRYQQAGHKLDPEAIAEISAMLQALGQTEDDRQELADAVVSLGAVAAMLQKLGDTAAQSAVRRLIAQQAHRLEDVAAPLDDASP